MDRYRLARAKGDYDDVVKEDAELLGEFGIGLISIDNGLRVVEKKSLRDNRVDPWNIIPVHPKLWRLLRPLLSELRDYRQEKKKINGTAVPYATEKDSSKHRLGRW